jgi:hypothetical protein
MRSVHVGVGGDKTERNIDWRAKGVYDIRGKEVGSDMTR